MSTFDRNPDDVLGFGNAQDLFRDVPELVDTDTETPASQLRLNAVPGPNTFPRGRVASVDSARSQIRVSGDATTPGPHKTSPLGTQESDTPKLEGISRGPTMSKLRDASAEISTSTSHDNSQVPSSSQTDYSSVEAAKESEDVTGVLVVGCVAASLIVVLTAVVLAVLLCYNRKCCARLRGKKNLSMNTECNRWDPQLLRPSRENIDAFVYGPPIPSVSEMIKSKF